MIIIKSSPILLHPGSTSSEEYCVSVMKEYGIFIEARLSTQLLPNWFAQSQCHTSIAQCLRGKIKEMWEWPIAHLISQGLNF